MITKWADVTTSSTIMTDPTRSADMRHRRSILVRLIAMRRDVLTRCLIHVGGHLRQRMIFWRHESGLGGGGTMSESKNFHILG